MKLTIFIMTVCLLQLSAATKAQITLNESKASLQSVLKNVSKQSGYDFIYAVPDFENARPVDVKLENATLEEALRLVFADQPLEYAISDKTVMVKKKAPLIIKSKLQLFLEGPIHLRGKVTDSLGTPLEGATISILKPTKEKNINTDVSATIVGNTGEFDIIVEEGDRIVISYVGYAVYSITAKEKMPFQNVILERISNKLTEVVIQTGYQTLSKERATGSFGKPDLQTFADRTGTTDIINRLEGLVPGLTVIAGPNGVHKNSFGDNTSTQGSLIRGTSTVLLNTAPLYIVNGVPVNDLGSVNQDDIADITVLKDAAASAIWGAQAANGVIIITTKQGVKNQHLKINYNGYVNFQGQPDFNSIPVLSSPQFIQASKQIFDPVTYPWSSLSKSSIAPNELIMYDQYRGLISAEQAAGKLDSLSNINNSQQIKDLWYRNAATTNHTLSASGGNNIYSFYASLGYINEKSNIPGQSSNTYRINLTQNINAGDRVKISLTTQVSDLRTSAQNPIMVTNTFLPYQLFRDVAGNNINIPFLTGYSESVRQDYQARSRINLDYVPLNEYSYAHSSTDNIQLNNTANVSVSLLKGLSFLGTYSYLAAPTTSKQYTDGKSLALRQQLLQFTVAPLVSSTPVYYLPTTGGTYISGNNNQRNWTVRNQLVYSSAVRKEKDKLNIQVGQEEREAILSNNSTTELGYNERLGSYSLLDYNLLSTQGIPGTVNGSYAIYNTKPFTESYTKSRFRSYFALASYSLEGKYNLDLSWRQDHSNLFGSDQSAQNKPIYSVGGKWQLSKERFMEPLNWVNNLALRATYGVTGNSPYVGSAATSDIAAPEQLGQLAGTAYTVTLPGNPKLFWEVTHTTNLGMDFSVLNNRLSGSIDVYKKVTTNLLGNSPLDPLSGFSFLVTNLGKLQNKGLELGLNSVNIRSDKFSWTSGLTFAYNKNKLDSYIPPNASSNIASIKILGGTYPGYALSPLFAHQFAGLDNLGDPQVRLANGTVTKTPSAATGDDLKYMGSTLPVYNGGFTNTFSYKGLSLTVNMIYSGGNVMRRDVNKFYAGRAYTGGFNDVLVSPDFLNRWQNPGDESFTNIPSYVAIQSTSNSRRNISYYTQGDINVVSASYAKIRDLTLSYNVRPKVLQMLGVQAVRIYAQATNFLIWAANPDGIDPEYISYSTGTRILEPYAHSYSLGVNVTF